MSDKTLILYVRFYIYKIYCVNTKHTRKMRFLGLQSERLHLDKKKYVALLMVDFEADNTVISIPEKLD